MFEPSSIEVGADDPFTLPKDPSGIVLMELYGLKKHLDLNEVRGFNRRDIDAWLTISGREDARRKQRDRGCIDQEPIAELEARYFE